MVRHIVFWRLNGATPEHRRAQGESIKAALEALNGRIPGLVRLEVGLDISGEENSSDVVLLSDFTNREALAAYHHHPDHLKAAETVKAARCERRVVDYEF